MILFKFIALLITLLYIPAHATTKVSLTTAEQAWLTKHPVIKVGGADWAPFDFVDRDGNYNGIANDYLKLIAAKTGLQFTVTIAQWSHNLQKIRDQQIDLLGAAYFTEARSQYVNYSTPYFEVLDYFFIRNDLKVKTLNDLNGKRVAIPKDYAHGEQLKKYYPQIKIITVNTFSDAIDAVLENRADLLYDTYIALSYALKKEGINSIVPFKSSREHSNNILHIITRQNAPELAQIIQKGLHAISAEEKQTIYNKWLGAAPKEQQTLKLTIAEQQWLTKHPIIRFTGDPNWLPYEAFDKQGHYIGIVAEHLQLIEQKLGIKIKIIPTKTWVESINKVKQGAIDILSETSDSDLKSHLSFTTPYISSPVVIVMNKDTDYVENITQIKQKKIAVIKEYGYVPKIIAQYPDINFIVVNSIQDGLTAVSTGKIDTLLATLAQSSYHISELGINNIRIVGKTQFTTKLAFGMRKEFAPLIPLFNRALNAISKAEKQQILNTWGKQKFVAKVDYTLLALLASISIIIISIIIYWNRKLAQEIQRRKETEQALSLAKYAAETATKAKSEFLSNMSHEIRTPMNAIIGFTELLDEQVQDPKLKSFVKTIQSAGNNLLVLINDILDLSKIEAGKLQIVKTACNPHDLFTELGNIFMMKMRAKDIDFILDIDPIIPQSLQLDATRLRQVLFNLIGNAVKFTDHGFIRITARTANEDELHSKLDLLIAIQDSGIGISTDQQQLIFQDFEQSSGQDIRKYGGTGLGLSISKRLVEMMDGELLLTSQLGQGATFTIKLTQVDIASLTVAKEHNTEPSQTISFLPSKILIVDDVADNRELLLANFADTQLKTTQATNGQEAVNLAKQQQFELILMDIRMPVLNGYQAAKQIKQFTNTPIIALTASVMQDEFERIRSSNFDGYLRKPVLKADLNAELSKFLPFTETNLTEQSLTEAQLSHTEKVQLPQVLSQLTALKAQCSNISKRNNIAEIKEFANSIREIAQQHPIPLLPNYAEQLLSNIDCFDIAAIKCSLQEFPLLIEQLESLNANV